MRNLPVYQLLGPGCPAGAGSVDSRRRCSPTCHTLDQHAGRLGRVPMVPELLGAADVTSGTVARTLSSDDGGKGLKSGALGLVSSVVIGVASTAPAYSLAATLGFIVLLVGLQAPA